MFPSTLVSDVGGLRAWLCLKKEEKCAEKHPDTEASCGGIK